MTTSETVVFNGVTFRRYPNSKRREDRSYFKPVTSAQKRGVEALHREVWKHHNGPIPDGHHVHHRDENPLNNDPLNLECIPASAHLSHHQAIREVTPEMIAHFDRIRPLTKEWHGSPEGLAWHSQHGKAVWVNRKPEALKCEQCGKGFETLVPSHSRFCTNACKSARRRASGVDNEQRACIACSASFSVNQYSKAKACSRRCAGAIRARARDIPRQE